MKTESQEIAENIIIAINEIETNEELVGYDSLRDIKEEAEKYISEYNMSNGENLNNALSNANSHIENEPPAGHVLTYLFNIIGKETTLNSLSMVFRETFDREFHPMGSGTESRKTT